MATIFAGGYAFVATLATLLSTALFFAPDRMRSAGPMAALAKRGCNWPPICDRLPGPSHDVLAAVDGCGGGHWHQLDARFSPERLVVGLCGSRRQRLWLWARQLSLWTVLMISPTPGSSSSARPATFMDACPRRSRRCGGCRLDVALPHLPLVLVGGFGPFCGCTADTGRRSVTFDDHE